MELIIGKDIQIVNPSYKVIAYCDNELTIDNPDYIIANRLGRYVGRMEKKLCLYVRNANSIIVPFGCLSDIWEIASSDNVPFTYKLNFNAIRHNNLKGSINLYDYQRNALERLKMGKNGILEAPCGSGKTQIGLALIQAIGGKALWLTHTKKLLMQSKERAESLLEGDYGTITEGKVNIGKDITFATVQTMRELDPSIYKDAFDIVVVDECHHAVGSPTKVMQFYKVISNLNCRYKYGLSATLSRADKMDKCVYSLLGKKLHTITEEEVGSKIIKAIHMFTPVDYNYDVLSYSNEDGTLDYGKLINLLSLHEGRNKQISTFACTNYSAGRKQLILCHRIKQIEILARMIKKQNKNIKISVIKGSMKQSDRDYDADIIIATYNLAKEGLDIPTLDLVHFATPQKDETIVKQSAGRVERNIPNKKKPIIMDYVDKNIPYCMTCYRQRKNILKSK